MIVHFFPFDPLRTPKENRQIGDASSLQVKKKETKQTKTNKKPHNTKPKTNPMRANQFMKL